MYLNTFNGLDQTIRKHPICTKRTKEAHKKKIIDKSNVFIHFILEKNKHIWEQKNKTESAPLHSTILKSQLGKPYYKEIINALIDLEIVAKPTGYKVGVHSKKYRLTDKALKTYEIIKAGVLCEKTAQKLNKYKNEMLKSYMLNPIHKNIIYSITDIKFIDFENGEKHIDSIRFESEEAKRFYVDSYNELKKFNKLETFQDYINSSFYYIQDKKGNRVYNSLTNIPKQLRRRLRTNTDEQLTELDLTNAQPLIMFGTFLNSIKTQTAPHKDIKEEYRNEYINKNKNIINNIKYICGSLSISTESFKSFGESLLNDTFYDNFRNKAIELGFTDIDTTSRNSVKKYVLKALYCYPNEELNNPEKVLGALSKGFLKWIRNVKIELNKLSQKDKYYYSGNKLFSWMIQNKESDIFIRNFFTNLEKDIFAVPVHDAIICRVEDAEAIKLKIVQAFRQEFEQFKEQTILNIIKQKDYV